MLDFKYIERELLSVVQSFSWLVLLESVNKSFCAVTVTVDYDSVAFVLS